METKSIGLASFSTLALLACRAEFFCLGRGFLCTLGIPVACWLLPTLIMIKDFSRHCWMSSGEQNPPQVENHRWKLTVPSSSTFPTSLLPPFVMYWTVRKSSHVRGHCWTEILKNIDQTPSIIALPIAKPKTPSLPAGKEGSWNYNTPLVWLWVLNSLHQDALPNLFWAILRCEKLSKCVRAK